MLPNRNPQDLMADQFGFAPHDFASTTTFTPHYRSIVIPATAIFNLDHFLGCHAYLRVTVPFVWASTNSDVTRISWTSRYNTSFPAGYFGLDALLRQSLLSRKHFNEINQSARLLNRLILAASPANNQIDSLQILLSILASIPSLMMYIHLVFCSRPDPKWKSPAQKYLFEPFVGNGHHWELGVGLKGHHQIWCNGYDHEFSIYLSLMLTHVFKAASAAHSICVATDFGAATRSSKTLMRRALPPAPSHH